MENEVKEKKTYKEWLDEALNKQNEAFKDDKLMFFIGTDDIGTAKIEYLIKQPIDGLLYDLNRDYATIMNIFPERMIFNEMAITKLIAWLVKRVHQLEEEKKEHEGNSNK